MSAKIRSIRKPEPYKGKGIKYIDERIRRKAGKIVGGATVATTKSLSVMVGLVSVGNLTDDIFILVPISSPAKSISIFSGIFSATHCNSTLRLTTFKTPPLFNPGESFLFLKVTGISKIIFEPSTTRMKSI